MTGESETRWDAHIDNMIERHLERSPGLTRRTVSDYRSSIRSLLRKMDEYGLETDPGRIGPKELNSVYSIFQEEGIAVATGKSYVHVLKMYCRAAGNESLEGMRLRWSTDSSPNAMWLSYEDSRRLIDADLNPEQRLLIHLELCLGMRRIDVIRLRPGYVDWGAKVIHILGKGHGRGKQRPVDFITEGEPNMLTEKALRDYLGYRDAMVAVARGRDPSAEVPDRLLIYLKGDRLGGFSEDGVAVDNRMAEVSRVTGVAFSNHTLRRTFGRAMYYSGVPLEDLAAIMGHDDPKVTFRYLGLGKVSHARHMNMLEFRRGCDGAE